MKNSNKEKRINKKIIFAVIIILFLVIGVTVSYFMMSKSINIGNIESGTLSMDFLEGTDVIALEKSIPIYKEDVDTLAQQISFSIENIGTLDMYTNIYFKDITIDDELKDYDFKWRIEESNTEDNENAEIIGNGTFAGSHNSKNIYLIQNRLMKPNEKRYYKVSIWVEETGLDQGRFNGKSFSGKIGATGYAKEVEPIPNPPELAEGMIPVVYDEEADTWKKADEDIEWYNYKKQMWANAVTVGTDASNCDEDSSCVDDTPKHTREEYLEAKAGTKLSMDDINSMWVWIPRYKYRIPSSIGRGTTTPPEIEVVFETGLSSTGVDEESYRSGIKEDGTNEKFYTHPAFRDGSEIYNSTSYDIGGWDKELTGIWVGKFETSGTVDYPLIKPNIISLTSNSISKEFNIALKFSGGILNEDSGEVNFEFNQNYGLLYADSHMMKSTEWGAVAYFSQSKYGKMGNSNFILNDKEIYKNNSTSVYTGRSSGKPADGNLYDSYGYNDKKCLSTDPKICTGDKENYKGTGASTTGTIYGIYDLSAGRWEHTMANYNKTIQSSEFLVFPERKYYDLYYSDVIKTGAILGDATWETFEWYRDYGVFPSDNRPWAVRGGQTNGDSSGAGVFASHNYSGNGMGDTTFRVVLVN